MGEGETDDPSTYYHNVGNISWLRRGFRLPSDTWRPLKPRSTPLTAPRTATADACRRAGWPFRTFEPTSESIRTARDACFVNRVVILAAVVLAILVVSAVAFIQLPAGSAKTTSGSSETGTTTTTLACGTGSGSAESDWTTYHGGNSRSGFSGISADCALAGWRSQALDGDVYAEPLVYNGAVFVATENDSVYALNATTGVVIWRTNVGTPVQGSTLPCGDINPSGITGTPVIDPTTGTLYAVAFEAPAAHYLVGLSVRDGRVILTRPADPSGADPTVEQERGALSLSGGMVYIPDGGLAGDCGQYHGWVVGLRANGSGTQVSYQVPTSREGGIWAPSGAATDSSGDLYVATGNGASESVFDHGDAVIKLSPTLQELGYFAPSNWQQLNQADTDLGSVGPLLVGNGEIFQIGKEGVGYLLDPANLGGIGGELFSGQVCASAFGGAAVAGTTIFVPCTDGLVALGLSSGSFHTLWRSPSFSAGPPIVTGGVVWTLDTSNGTLRGYNANTGAEQFSFNTGGVTRFTTPSTGDGMVYVAAGTEVFSFRI